MLPILTSNYRSAQTQGKYLISHFEFVCEHTLEEIVNTPGNKCQQMLHTDFGKQSSFCIAQNEAALQMISFVQMWPPKFVSTPGGSRCTFCNIVNFNFEIKFQAV